MTVSSIRGVVETAIRRASEATGADFGFLLGTARRESGGNPQAKANTSSAAGLFQFVDQTWLSTLKKHGAKYGYGRYAELISQGGDGRFRVSGPEARKAVMDLKFDPHAASLMAGELASDHAAYLRGRVGRMPTSGELYAAHFLGPQGSARLIEANRSRPTAPAAALFPEAAASNRSIFYRQGRAATVAEVYANLTRSRPASSGTGAEFAQAQPRQPQAAIPAASTPPAADKGFLQYGDARRRDQARIEQQALLGLILKDDSASSPASSMFSSELLKTLSQAQRTGLK